MSTKKSVLFSVLLAVGIITTSLASCATISSVGGTADTHGLFSGAVAAANGASEIASYSIILGLVDVGYDSYVSAVRQAEASGKVVTSMTRWYLGFVTKVTAYASN
jgi:hypothetical protein